MTPDSVGDSLTAGSDAPAMASFAPPDHPTGRELRRDAEGAVCLATPSGFNRPVALEMTLAADPPAGRRSPRIRPRREDTP